MTRALTWLALVASAAGAAGCSAIPAGRAPYAVVGPAAEPSPLHLAVAAPVVGLALDEVYKGYLAHEVLDGRELAEDAAAWISATGAYRRVQTAPTLVEGAFDRAWERGDDLLLDVRVRDVRVTFDGHNGWYVPNLINWWVWMVPAWFVATEEYTLSFVAEVALRSVDSTRSLDRTSVPVAVSGTFDEFDRGFQFLGFIRPDNEPSNWRRVGGKLFPAARAQLGAELGRWAYEGRERLASPEAREGMAKTLALVVGLAHYEQPVARPPLPFAVSDAAAVVAALTGGHAGLARRQVRTLVDQQATRQGLQAALDELRERLRPDDQLLVYFAGYGGADREGRPALLLHGADEALPLPELGALLAALPCRKLSVLACGFSGHGGRSAGGAGARDFDVALEAFAQASGGAALAASGPGGAVLAPQHLGAGLFDHHFARGLAGAADRDADGRITARELFRLAHDQVLPGAAFQGEDQAPLAAGLEGDGFALRRAEVGQGEAP